MSASELKWIEIARSFIGTKEIRGPKTSPTISTMLSKLHAWWTDDETPWCGTFVANCLNEAGLKYPTKWMTARAYAESGFGVKLEKPAYGCIVVFSRDGGGHVGFLVGQDKRGNLMVLGGNQGDMVKIAPFAKSRVLAYVWPSTYPTESRFRLPVLDSDGKLSTNEA